jgi:hypothetical protein
MDLLQPASSAAEWTECRERPCSCENQQAEIP